MTRFRLCLLSTAALLAFGRWDGAGAQTLQDVLVSTYESNPQMEADRARQRSVDDDVARAMGGWRPTATVTGEAGRGHDIMEYNNSKAVVPTGNPPPYPAYSANPVYSVHEWRTPETLLLQIQQSIYDGGRTSADVRHAELVVENGLATMVATEQTVLGATVQAYYDLYRDQEIYELTKQNVDWLEEQVQATHARYAVKDVTQTDVAEAEARLARGLADQTAAEGTLEASRSAFVAAAGVTPGILPKPPAAPIGLLPPSREAALDLAESNPDMRSAKLTEKAAQADVDYVESAMNPTLSLQAQSRRLEAADQAYINSSDNQVLLALTIPLYEGGVYAARTRGAKHVVGQRRLQIDAARRKAVDQVNRSWQSLLSSRASIKSLTEQVRAAEVARTSIRAEVRVGTRTVLDQLNTEQELMDAKIGLLRAQHDEVVATYSVLVSVGHLTASALGLPVQTYDPSVHYEQVRNQWFGTGINESYEKPPAVR